MQSLWVHRLIRRAAWRWPALAQRLWLWSFAGCRVYLVVELTKAAAARLDHAAILGLGHDREQLALAYRLQCGCMHGPDCHLSARLDLYRHLRVAPLVAEAVVERRRIVATPGQEHFFDRYGYGPGVYEFDMESERALLSALHSHANAQPVAPHLPADECSGHRCQGCDHGGRQQQVVAPAHAYPLSSPPRAEHSAVAPRA